MMKSRKVSVWEVAALLASAAVVATIPASASPNHANAVRQGSGVFLPAGSRLSPNAVNPTDNIQFGISLPLTHEADLDVLLTRLYDPKDPLYGHYLTPTDFSRQFGASQADFDATVSELRSHGFNVKWTSPNRTYVVASGPAAQVNDYFQIHLRNYVAADGKQFHAPDTAPLIPGSLVARGGHVIGLNNGIKFVNHSQQAVADLLSPNLFFSTGANNSGLAPSDIRKAYGLTSTGYNGAGQTLGLYELDDYADSDVTGYATQYSLGTTNVVRDQVIAVSAPGGGQGEVTLDIDMMLALTPAAKIVVYETPNTLADGLTELQAIANDTTNHPRQISSSWGMGEDQATSSFTDFSYVNSENSIFKQLAAQGQAYFVASGDTGAYGDRNSPYNVMAADPATQPLITAVGGTTLYNHSDETYNGEIPWSAPSNTNQSPSGSGSGGGISQIWAIPDYQKGLVTDPNSSVSSSFRNFPDVALNADINTGYSVYLQGAFTQIGGTSAAAPLWASYWAIVNQQRAAAGEPALGFANPYLYRLAKTSNYTKDFHDITFGDNLYYTAETGYDLTTGLGTINTGLISDLVNNASAGEANVVFFENGGTGQIALWKMNQTTRTATYSLGTASGWTIVGSADFNRDGHPDVLLQNQSSNKLVIWYTNGTALTSWTAVGTVPAASWKAVGTGDFNGDGYPDIVFQNTSTMQIAIWYMQNAAVQASVGVAKTPTSGWNIAGCADFNGDGNSDIVFQNASTGQLAVWYMLGSTFVSGASVPNSPGTGWRLAAAVNLFGRAQADLIFQKSGVANPTLWKMYGTTVAGTATLPAVTTGWNILGPK